MRSGLASWIRLNATRPLLASVTVHCWASSQERTRWRAAHRPRPPGCAAAGVTAELPQHRGQAFPFDRLHQVSGGAERHATAVLVGDADHDHRRVGDLGVLTKRRQHRPAVEIGHHDVERDRHRPQFLGELDTLDAAISGCDRKPFRLSCSLIRSRAVASSSITRMHSRWRPGYRCERPGSCSAASPAGAR